MTKPYRVLPTDFAQSFILMGWTEIEEHYRTNYRCVGRWIRQAGDDVLRWERRFVTGRRTRPELHSHRYADAFTPAPAPELRPVWWSKPGAKTRLTLTDHTRQELPTDLVERVLGATLQSVATHARPNHRQWPNASVDDLQQILGVAMHDGGVAVAGDQRLRVDKEIAKSLAVEHLSDTPIEGARAVVAFLLTRSAPPPPERTN